MRELDARELDLLANGANSLASSWRLRQLRNEIRRDPDVVAAGKKYGRGRNDRTTRVNQK